jgi:hypothetical protein
LALGGREAGAGGDDVPRNRIWIHHGLNVGEGCVGLRDLPASLVYRVEESVLEVNGTEFFDHSQKLAILPPTFSSIIGSTLTFVKFCFL